MTDIYTFREYADMHLILSEASGNGGAVVLFYSESYPQRRLPNPQTFRVIECRIRVTGTVRPPTVDIVRNEHLLHPYQFNGMKALRPLAFVHSKKSVTGSFENVVKIPSLQCTLK
jgi:hypothetical protein